MIEIYTLMPACVDYEEARVSRDIDREIEVRKSYIDLGVVSPWG